MKDLMQIAYEKAKKDKAVETLGEAAAFKLGYESALKWIKVSESLPENLSSVIGCFDQNKVGNFYYQEMDKKWYQDGWGNELSRTFDITHWMPLPNPPES